MFNKVYSFLVHPRKNLRILKLNNTLRLKIDSEAVIDKESIFEGGNAVASFALVSKSTFGFASYVGGHSRISRTKIGKYTDIAEFVHTDFGSHPTDRFVSSHAIFYNNDSKISQLLQTKSKNKFPTHKFTDNTKEFVCEIGNDVWIGEGVLILDGVRIGDGAIIGAGAVVTKDVLPYSIVGGVPAKLIRYRFSESQIKKLMKIQWWNWDFEEIKKNINKFGNIEAFLEEFSPKNTNGERD